MANEALRAMVIALCVLPARGHPVYRYDPKTFEAGLESQELGGGRVKVYNVARTLADCFKFRNKIGLDVALEALQLARQRKKVSNRELLHYARLLRVERLMQPYLQIVP